MPTSVLETERRNLVESIKKLTVAQQSKLNAYLKFNHLSIDSIAQDTVLENNVKRKIEALKEPEPKTKKAKKVKDHGKHLTIYSKVRSLALKFYPEQLMTPEKREEETDPQLGRIPFEFWQDGAMLKLAKSAMKERVDKFSERFNKLKSPRDTKKRHWEIEVICHDRDYKADPDDMSLPSVVKPHFHLLLRDANGNRFTVETILKALNLFYDPKKDSKLFYEQGCTTVKNFASYSMYLTHETEQAQIDGKEVYDISEVITNMTLKELQDIRAGYQRLQPKAKLSTSDWLELADEATKLAKEMGDFEEWSHTTLNFVQRSETKFKHLHELYNKVLNDTVEQAPDLTRCCILISGKANDGKSYTTRHALQAMGETIYNARSGSGKYDGLTSRATAMVFDDRRITDALKVTDNCATVVHGRGTGNDKPWLGHYVVVTTNLTPGEFFKSQVMNNSEVPAIATRFYVSQLIYDENRNGRLYATDYGIRGMYDDVSGRHELYEKFADSFNKTIKGYHPLTREEAPELAPEYVLSPEYLASSTSETILDPLNCLDPIEEIAHLKTVVSGLIGTLDAFRPNCIFDTSDIIYKSPRYYELVQFLEYGAKKAEDDPNNPFNGIYAEGRISAGKTWEISELLALVKSGKFPFENCAYIEMIC